MLAIGSKEGERKLETGCVVANSQLPFCCVRRHSWRYAFALAYLLLGTGLANSQQSEGVVQVGPPEEEVRSSVGQGVIAEGQRPPFPITIIESPDGEARAAERERKSDEHETADLEAQRQAADGAQRAAAAAERQETPTLFLSFVGAAIALLALVFTGWTFMRAEKTSRAQLRAYVTLTPTYVRSFNSATRTACEVKVQNKGNTPAKNLQRAMIVRLLPPPIAVPNEATGMDTGTVVGMSIAANGEQTFGREADVVFSTEEIAGIKSSTLFICAFVRVTYEDIFGKSHVEEAGFYATADDASLKKLASKYAARDLVISFVRIEGYGRST